MHSRECTVESICFKFQDGNAYGEVYEDLIIITIPLLKVVAQPILGTSEIKFVPAIGDVRTIIKNCFTTILGVTANVPRVENIMFPGTIFLHLMRTLKWRAILDFAKNKTYLTYVYEEEEEVGAIISEGMSIFEVNTIGPGMYLKMYEDYHYLLNGEAENDCKAFMSQDPIPLLKVPHSWLPLSQLYKRTIVEPKKHLLIVVSSVFLIHIKVIVFEKENNLVVHVYSMIITNLSAGSHQKNWKVRPAQGGHDLPSSVDTPEHAELGVWWTERHPNQNHWWNEDIYHRLLYRQQSQLEQKVTHFMTTLLLSFHFCNHTFFSHKSTQHSE